MPIESAVVGKVDYRDIESDTAKNSAYRRVIYTVPGRFQNVLMSLAPGETIPSEVHRQTTQFVRVESGTGRCIVDGKEYALHDGVAITIPPGARHKFENTSKRSSLKLYSIYTPPEHASDCLQRRQ